jgi:hypothetical protein
MKKNILAFTFLLLSLGSMAQGYKNGKLYLNEDGSNFVKMTLLNQIWVTQNDNNPGSTLYGFNKPNSTDIGIRRLRMQLFGQITDRTYIYVQVGENNFNALSDRKLGLFVHDAVAEYSVVKNKLSIGGGLTGWSGLARFASPSVGSFLGVDAPLYQQATNDVTDQFLRKLSVYAKGKLGKLDYRIALTDPMAIQKSSTYNAAITKNSSFASSPAKFQSQGYFQYQFLDQESNQNPYTTGSYYGAKKVFNIGAGFIYQPDAMWHLADNGRDTLKTAMTLLSVDAFYDAPINTATGTAVSAYVAYSDYNFGKNYTRNGGPLNPTNGSSMSNVLNGGGNSFPMYGTGQTVFAQVGYKLNKNLLGKSGALMPYASIQHSNYEKLSDAVNFYDVGMNWLLPGGTSKFTLAYQNRPVYTTNAIGEYHETERKGGFILQYQVFLN